MFTLINRIITGVFDCLTLPVGCMYISEISERKFRGSFLNSTAVSFGLGIALGYLFGSYLPWRYSDTVPIFSNIISIAILCYCYESPVYLLIKNLCAKDSLQWYRQLQDQLNVGVDKLTESLKQCCYNNKVWQKSFSYCQAVSLSTLFLFLYF